VGASNLSVKFLAKALAVVVQLLATALLLPPLAKHVLDALEVSENATSGRAFAKRKNWVSITARHMHNTIGL